MHNLAQRFGRNLKQVRESKHLTQFQLGIEVDATEDAIANYENGRRWPGVEIIEALATVLEVDPEVFFKKVSLEKG